MIVASLTEQEHPLAVGSERGNIRPLAQHVVIATGGNKFAGIFNAIEPSLEADTFLYHQIGDDAIDIVSLQVGFNLCIRSFVIQASKH